MSTLTLSRVHYHKGGPRPNSQNPLAAMSTGVTVQRRVRISSSPWPETGAGRPKLHKQGPLEKQGSRLKTWSWKRYWFVLHEDKLSYFKEGRMSSALSQGLIDLCEAQVVKSCTSTNRGFPFEIVLRTKRYVLSATTSQERDSWLDFLHRAMTITRPVSGPIHEPTHGPTYGSVFRDDVCNSIEDVDGMSEQIHTMLLQNARAFSTPETILEKDEPFSSPSDPSSPVFMQQRDSGCESGEMSGDRDSSGQRYDPMILRKNKKAVTRLHPTVSNAEASSFLYDSIRRDSEDDVFTIPSSSKDPVIAKDSGLSGVSISGSEVSSIYEDVDFNYPAVPDLPNPRLEMTWGSSPFDQIRLFLANNRGPDECFPTPDKGEGDGKAIHKLKQFLAAIEGQ